MCVKERNLYSGFMTSCWLQLYICITLTNCYLILLHFQDVKVDFVLFYSSSIILDNGYNKLDRSFRQMKHRPFLSRRTEMNQ